MPEKRIDDGEGNNMPENGIDDGGENKLARKPENLNRKSYMGVLGWAGSIARLTNKAG